MPLIVGLLVWWLWLPAVLVVIKGFNHLFLAGMTWTQSYDLWLFNFVLNGVFPWIFLLVGCIGTVVGTSLYVSEESEDPAPLHWLVVAVGVVLAMVGTWFTWTGLWDNDKDFGRYYAYSTAVYVKDPAKVPDSINRLIEGSSESGDCARQGMHDVFSCVKQGTLSSEGWDPRVSSFTGAQIAMQRKVGEVQRASLAIDTVTYINADDNQPAMWTGVLDGSGKEQPMVGVVEWEGKGDARLCKFEGDYTIKRAFDGERGNNLPNMLAETYPKFRWDKSDVWGYCDGEQPVVVVPVKQPVLWMHRTVDTAAGIVVIRGDHGNLKMEHFASVEPGTYPGPVYPMSLVVKQREQAMWIAGRKNYDRFGFGYEPTTSEVQQGNVSEYLLRDKATGRLVYVTPLTLRNSDSEVFVTFAVSYADEVESGQLNELLLYVLDDGDPRRMNIDTLASTANTWMMNNAPMFRANQGELIEYTPINGEVWRVFGEMNNQVVYQLDISLNSRIKPQLVSLGLEYETGTPPSAPVPGTAVPSDPNGRSVNADCANPLGSLTPPQLAQCAKAFVDELAGRQAVPAPPK